MKKNLCKICAALLAFASLAFFSCAQGQFSDGGSISFVLPDSGEMSSMSAKSPSLSRSVYSSGALVGNGDISDFVVVARNFSLKKEVRQTVSPGSLVTIDDLEAGTWEVAVMGRDSSGGVLFYGFKSGIDVVSGQTSDAALSIKSVSEPYLSLELGSPAVGAADRSDASCALVAFSDSRMARSVQAFYEMDLSNNNDIEQPQNDNSKINVPLPDFLEPGHAYAVDVTLYSSSGREYWKNSFSASVPSDGGAIGGELAYCSEYLETEGQLNSTVFVDDNISDVFAYAGVTFKFYAEGDTNGQDVSVALKKLSPLCGKIPIIASYQGRTWCMTREIYREPDTPALKANDIYVPLGLSVTRDAAWTYPSSAPMHSVFKTNVSEDGITVYDIYGFSKYAVLQNQVQDDWSYEIDFSTIESPDAPNSVVSYNNNMGEWFGVSAGIQTFVAKKTVSADIDKYSAVKNPESGDASVSQAFSATCVPWTVSAPSDIVQSSEFNVTLKNSALQRSDLDSITDESLTFEVGEEDIADVQILSKSAGAVVVRFKESAVSSWQSGEQKEITAKINGNEIGSFNVYVNQF